MPDKEKLVSIETLKKKSKEKHGVNKDSFYYLLVQENYEKEKEEQERAKAKAERKQMLKNIFKINKTKKPEYIDYENRIEKIRSTVLKGRLLLKKDIYAARTMYTMLENLYKELPEPLKAKAFVHIQPFYKDLENEIKNLYDGNNQSLL